MKGWKGAKKLPYILTENKANEISCQLWSVHPARHHTHPSAHAVLVYSAQSALRRYASLERCLARFKAPFALRQRRAFPLIWWSISSVCGSTRMDTQIHKTKGRKEGEKVFPKCLTPSLQKKVAIRRQSYMNWGAEKCLARRGKNEEMK